MFAQRGRIFGNLLYKSRDSSKFLIAYSIHKRREKANLYYVCHQLEVCILVNNIAVHLQVKKTNLNSL